MHTRSFGLEKIVDISRRHWQEFSDKSGSSLCGAVNHLGELALPTLHTHDTIVIVTMWLLRRMK